jgi:CubicO group peptidase (beta-lactamase class C family)
LAGAMMEKITNRSFVDLMAEIIFRPLNLSTAGYGAPAEFDPMSQPWGHELNNSSFIAVERDYPHWLDLADLGMLDS